MTYLFKYILNYSSLWFEFTVSRQNPWREEDYLKNMVLYILIRQYRSLLVPTSAEQTEMAKSRLKTAPQAAKTVLVEGSKFSVAEARHQKNRLRRDPAMVRCLVQSGHEDFTSSFLATRLNGWESWQSWSPFITLFHLVQVSGWQRVHGSVQQGVAGPWPKQRPGFSHQKSNH